MVEEEGQLKGAFNGFKDSDTVFQFHGGRAWRQAEYKYNYYYAYMPYARVTYEGGRYVLEVEGIDDSVEVRRA